MENQLGGHKNNEKALIFKDDIIYKIDNQKESEFYVDSKDSVLSTYLPKFYGTEVIDLGYGEIKYFKMENLIYNFKGACTMDIKIGTRTSDETKTPEKNKMLDERDKNTTLFKNGFRFTGLKIFDSSTKSSIIFERNLVTDDIELLKNSLKTFLLSHGKICDENNFSFSLKILNFNQLTELTKNLNNTSIDVNEKELYNKMIDKLLGRLNKFKVDFEKSGYQLVSSSLFLYYEKSNPLETLNFSMIDFSHWRDRDHHSPIPDGYLYGIENLIKTLEEIKVK